MAPELLTDEELRRIELAATAAVASRRPGPSQSSPIPESVRADIGRYLVLEAGQTMLRLVAEVRRLQAAVGRREG